VPAMSSEQAVRDELVRLLRYANFSAIGRELGVSAQAVKNWAEGRNTSPARLNQVRSLYGLDTQEETPRPEWAEGLEDRIAERLEARLSLEVPERVVERVATRLGLPQPRSAGGLPEHIEAPRDSADTTRPPSK
jgi:predicted transcriptional regulator